jgi:transmembrane 9 superfamily protein 2/4
MWHHTLFYYFFGFLFLCFIVLMVTSAEVSILMSYILLCREDYRWWWLSFAVAGSSGVYLFLYSVLYFLVELSLTRFSSVVLYLGYMLVMSIGYSLITGTIGFLATFYFIRLIYSLIKVE